MEFNPNEHLIQLKSKAGDQDYLPVKWRLVWFRAVHPHGTIDTEEVVVDLDRIVETEAFVWNPEKRRSEKVTKQAKGYARFRAVATDGKGGRATGTKSESAASFPDYVEKSETGAIGRALAALGFGTQFTNEEFNEGERLADAPVERTPPAPTGQTGSSRPTAEEPTTSATDQQIASIRKMYDALGEKAPATLAQLSFQEAATRIRELATRSKEAQRRKVS